MTCDNDEKYTGPTHLELLDLIKELKNIVVFQNERIESLQKFSLEMAEHHKRLLYILSGREIN